jgi:hypothetical protein
VKRVDDRDLPDGMTEPVAGNVEDDGRRHYWTVLVVTRAPTPRFQAPNPRHSQSPIPNGSTGFGALRFGSALELGAWSLGFDSP